MKNVNSVVLSGNVVADAKPGNACRFSICVKTAKKAGTTWEDQPNFFDCVIFGTYGEKIAPKLIKGVSCVVSGTLHQEKWTSKDGTPRQGVYIYVDNVDIMRDKAHEGEEAPF